MKSIIFSYLLLHKPVAYLSIFIGLIFEGDILIFTSAFLAHQGVFHFKILIPIAYAGVLLGDTLWYLAGVWLNNSTSCISRWINRNTSPFDTHLLQRPFHTILISKFAYCLHHPLLARAGALGIEYKKLIKLDAIATLIWGTIIGGLGYFAGASFSLVKHYFRFAEFALLIALIIFIILERFISSYTKRKIQTVNPKELP